MTRYGESKPFSRNVFVLGTCSLIVNTQILEFDKKEKMLMAWRDFVETVDPDMIIGYNIATDRSSNMANPRLTGISKTRN